MAFLSAQTWYAGSTKWSAVAAWAASTAYTVGQLVRQNVAPTAGSERVFVCVAAGTTSGTEPTWVTTHGSKTTDNTVTWQDVTGKAAVNGDPTNTSDWNSAKSTSVSLGVVIKNIAGTHFFICTTAGTAGSGSEPSWNTTAGATTTDNAATWTSLGAVGGFADWGAPAAKLNLFCASGPFSGPGHTVYISQNHSESWSSAVTYTSSSSGSTSLPLTLLCVNVSAAPPTASATGALVSTTGANALSFGFYYHASGLTLTAGSGAVSVNLGIGSSASTILEDCVLAVGGTSGGNLTLVGGTGGRVELRNCAMTFASTASAISSGSGRAEIIGGSIAATGSVPTALFSMSAAGTSFTARDVDLSAVTGTLFSLANGRGELHNCKLGSGVALLSAAPDQKDGALGVKIYNCDSTNSNYRHAAANSLGTTVSETSVVRSGGASDGTTPVSLLATSRSNARYGTPYCLEEIAQWNDTTGGSKTATVELTTDTALTNADCWLEIEYPASSSFPTGAVVTTRAALLATPVALTTSSETWGGAAKTHKYKITASFTPQMKGPIKGRVYLALASTAVYVDPLLVIA